MAAVSTNPESSPSIFLGPFPPSKKVKKKGEKGGNHKLAVDVETLKRHVRLSFPLGEFIKAQDSFKSKWPAKGMKHT